MPHMCGLYIVTNFQRTQYKKEEKTLVVEKPQTLTQMIKVRINRDKSCWHYVLWLLLKWYLTSMVFLTQKNKPNIIMSKSPDKFQLRDISQMTWLYSAKKLRSLELKRELKWQSTYISICETLVWFPAPDGLPTALGPSIILHRRSLFKRKKD